MFDPPARMPTPQGTSIPTLHIGRGSVLKPLLRQAAPQRREIFDPRCQGPVQAQDDWLIRHAAFLTEAARGFTDL